MTESLKSFDITSAPEILRLAEEVRQSNTPRLLKRGDEALAKIVPLKHHAKPRGKADANRAAFLASAGGWAGLVDTDKLITDIYESRRISTRPPIEL